MNVTRRTFIRSAIALTAAVIGPWSLAARKSHAATLLTPALQFLTPGEYRFINRMARQIVPDAPVLEGTVDVAKNIDRFFVEKNASPDFLIMLRYLRLARLVEPVLAFLEWIAPPVYEDIVSLKRTICFLGYYSDANGEAELPEAGRIVWPRIGYGGPKPPGWQPPASEIQLDPALLPDRIEQEPA